ncbi:MAG: anaerobic ribonucleoside-triphosphate reductase [Candidatus Bathyarchaeia archaeon]
MAVQKGSEVFDAASSPIRMEILKLLNAKGPLPYTEIMAAVNLDPVRDAGKFVYHLKSLIAAGLISLNEKEKKYNVTELGRMIVNFSRNIEEYIAVKKGKMFVRTSRFSIEEFNREKIVNSLVNEASVPYELAQEIAAEVEERLIKLGTKYLTAPLIREFVNSVLIEKKLEEYRHKLTRLGMPVYDVTQLFNFASEKKLNVNFIKEKAGEAVIKEYVLLNALPREVADAHLSGNIHLNGLTNWILAPNEVRHDIRFFLKKGFNSKPPKNFREALMVLRRVFYSFSREISEEQHFDMFNVFLAPYLVNASREEVKEALYQFLEDFNVLTIFNPPVNRLSLGLEFSIPKFLENVEAVTLNGEIKGVYGDYAQEANLLLDLIIDVALELINHHPLINPLLIFKVRDKDFQDNYSMLLKCHKLAVESSIPYFAFLNDNEAANYSSKGVKLTSSSDFWDVTLNAGNAGTVFINLPRIAYEAKGNDEQFKELLIKTMNLAAEALKVKKTYLNSALNKGLLPLLSKPLGNTFYYVKDNEVYTISFVGLNETAITHVGTGVNADEEALKFVINTLKIMVNEAANLSKKLDLRLLIAQLPSDEASTRLAKLDAEKYGQLTVRIQGSFEKPYYTDGTVLPASLKIPLENRIKIEAKIHNILESSSLPIYFETKRFNNIENLLKLSRNAKDKGVKFMFYTGDYSYCFNCSRIFPGILYKCLKCDTSDLLQIARTENMFTPLTLWAEAKRKDLENRICYALS